MGILDELKKREHIRAEQEERERRELSEAHAESRRRARDAFRAWCGKFWNEISGNIASESERALPGGQLILEVCVSGAPFGAVDFSVKISASVVGYVDSFPTTTLLDTVERAREVREKSLRIQEEQKRLAAELAEAKKELSNTYKNSYALWWSEYKEIDRKNREAIERIQTKLDGKFFTISMTYSFCGDREDGVDVETDTVQTMGKTDSGAWLVIANRSGRCEPRYYTNVVSYEDPVVRDVREDGCELSAYGLYTVRHSPLADRSAVNSELLGALIEPPYEPNCPPGLTDSEAEAIRKEVRGW